MRTWLSKRITSHESPTSIGKTIFCGGENDQEFEVRTITEKSSIKTKNRTFLSSYSLHLLYRFFLHLDFSEKLDIDQLKFYSHRYLETFVQVLMCIHNHILPKRRIN